MLDWARISDLGTKVLAALRARVTSSQLRLHTHQKVNDGLHSGCIRMTYATSFMAPIRLYG